MYTFMYYARLTIRSFCIHVEFDVYGNRYNYWSGSSLGHTSSRCGNEGSCWDHNIVYLYTIHCTPQCVFNATVRPWNISCDLHIVDLLQRVIVSYYSTGTWLMIYRHVYTGFGRRSIRTRRGRSVSIRHKTRIVSQRQRQTFIIV